VFEAGAQFGSIESVKAVSDLFCPMAGRVVEVNAALSDQPETVNAGAHDAWMIVMELSDPSGTDDLLNAATYTELVS
jgi:glycine cleavage system H protein